MSFDFYEIILYYYIFFFKSYGDPRDLHVKRHSFPTRRSSDLGDVAAERPARRARRAAINSRRAHGEDEGAVGAAVASARGVPVPGGHLGRDGLRAVG